MGNRMRFNAREKALIEQTQYVEVSYGSGQWINFELDTQAIVKGEDGYQHVMGTVTSNTNAKGQTARAISKGWRMWGTPGHVRPRGSDWKVT